MLTVNLLDLIDALTKLAEKITVCKRCTDDEVCYSHKASVTIATTSLSVYIRSNKAANIVEVGG